MANNLSDYSELNEYIQTWLKKNYSSSYILQDLFKPENYSIDGETLTVKYVSQSELEQLKKVQGEFMFFVSSAHFPIKNLMFVLDKEKQNKIARGNGTAEDRCAYVRYSNKACKS